MAHLEPEFKMNLTYLFKREVTESYVDKEELVDKIRLPDVIGGNEVFYLRGTFQEIKLSEMDSDFRHQMRALTEHYEMKSMFINQQKEHYKDQYKNAVEMLKRTASRAIRGAPGIKKQEVDYRLLESTHLMIPGMYTLTISWEKAN